MLIFREFSKTQSDQIYTKTHQTVPYFQIFFRAASICLSICVQLKSICISTKLHHLKKIFSGGMPPNPSSKAHCFAMRSMSLRDMQISKSGNNISWPPPCQILGTPL